MVSPEGPWTGDDKGRERRGVSDKIAREPAININRENITFFMKGRF